ncbi:MAG: IS4 family transposase [Verrucomicrobia bacterium]|nr:MAG: IS4 family transposase [Verrucomicrobiota bacterium]
MKSVDDLPRTTFSGRRFTKKQLAQVQSTVKRFSGLSRNELALTLCEHLSWKTPNGRNKINACLILLEKLEALEFITLPAKVKRKAAIRRVPAFEKHPDAPPINGTLDSVSPITLQRVISKEDRECWKAYLQTHHYLGYKHPVGSHIGYLIVSESKQQVLGCLLFTASAALSLAPRDKWIGWDKKKRIKLLQYIVSNNRFLIFPWIDVPNLASHVLSLATKQIGDDWVNAHGYRPVLIETFVDTTRYSGTCYRAANWHYLGQTQGRGRFDPKNERRQTIKDIFVCPLQRDWRQCLTEGHRNAELKKRYRNDQQPDNPRTVDDGFIELWKKTAYILHAVATEYDQKWQVRKRVINSLIMMLLIFRLVSSKNSQGYGTTIDDLWDSCDKLDMELPQKSSIAPSSFCEARKKLDEEIFKRVNQEIVHAYASEDCKYKWLGHRLFAVDGSKLNLPRKLAADGYKTPSDNAYYPQGLLSCLYEIKSQLPFDFDLVSHNNERRCALQHFKMLNRDDVVVYDRGYFSYHMLHQHVTAGIHAVFRLQESSCTKIREFFTSSETDTQVTIYPSRRVRSDLQKIHPDLDIIPLTMRLMKYEIGGSLFCLGTTLVEKQHLYPLQDFMDVYHSRWGVEELYKVSKRIFIVDDFHAKSERGVKQELFAHFVLITMSRLFSNRSDTYLNLEENSTSQLSGPNTGQSLATSQKIKTNFKNCIHVFSRFIEELICLNTKQENAIQRAFYYIVGRHQKARPGRSYARKSMRPETKWRPTKAKKKPKKITTSTIPA